MAIWVSNLQAQLSAAEKVLYVACTSLVATSIKTAQALLSDLRLQARMVLSTAAVCFILITASHAVSGQTSRRPTSVAVLDFGETTFAHQATETLRENLRSTRLTILDTDLVRAAAKGVGYSGSLNMSLIEARELGSAIASDFFVVGDAQTLRRTSSSVPIYFESYCSIFIINARTGQLIFWERPSYEDAIKTASEQSLLRNLATNVSRDRWIKAIEVAEADERARLSIGNESNLPIIEAPEDEKLAASHGLQLPRPYRRLRPEYPESAARADAEATVDVIVDVGADGEVSQVQVSRWAGFGLDEATITTVRKMHFFPAKQNGSPIPMRVLLRYNFRKTSQQSQ